MLIKTGDALIMYEVEETIFYYASIKAAHFCIGIECLMMGARSRLAIDKLETTISFIVILPHHVFYS